MSNNNPFSHDDNSSSPHDKTVEDAMKEALEETAYLVQHLEPHVRELNRAYRDVLGHHPDSADGNWVYLSRDENGDYFFRFYPISARRVALHSAHVGEHALVLDELSNDGSGVSADYSDIGATILGEVASLSHVPFTHVHVERRS